MKEYKGMFTNMNSLVRFQAVALCEFGVANVALVRLLS
jgi:hypothetical protein